MLNPQGVLLDQQPQITFYPSTPPSSQQLSPASSTFLHLISGIIKKGQDSKLGDASHKELSNITLRATIDQVNSLKITPAHSLNLQPQANPQEITISLNQIEQSLSNESLKDADRTTTLSTLKTALELYNQYFQEVFVGDENEELRNHLRKRLLSTEDREDENNLYDNIADSTDLSKIKQSATEIAQYFSIIALRKKKIRSVEEEEGVLAVERVGGVRVEEGIDGDQEIKNALITFPSNQNEDYLCLDGTRQRLQLGMFSLLKQDVIAQLLEQEVEDFVLKHVKEIDEGNQIHMKVTIYSAISTLDSANISKIDSFYLNPQKFLQQKDVLEFFDNLDDKIKKGLKARINEIEKQFDEVFKQEQGFLPNAGHIKDFKIFLKTNGFQDVEITDEEFCSPYFDQEGNLRDFTDQAPKETLKKILRERLLESITKKYPTLDIEKFESIFKKDITQAGYEDRIQDQYLPTNIDLFYDDASKSTKLDLSKINNLVAFFEDNSMRASSSQTQEPNIDNITKGLIILRNIGQNFKNSNPFYFLEFFEQFKQSTGLNFEDYFFEAQPQQDQSHPQSRQVKGIFKDYEGIIKYIINRRNILSKSLLQKPVSQIYIASEEQKELFEVCNSIFLGKEDEDSMRKIQDFKEKLNRDQFLAREVYNFFTQKERIFFVKLVESDDNEVLRKLIDLLPMVQKNQLKEYKPDAIKNLLHLAAQNGSSKVIDTLTNPDIVGININLNDDLGSTPLMIASQNGHLQVVKELIKKGADVNLQDVHGITPLIFASAFGHLQVVKELIANGADVNLKDDDGKTPLIFASAYGHLEVVKELIANGADVNLKDDLGSTPLMIASQNSHLQVVKELIKIVADVNLQDEDRIMVLQIAIKNNHPDVFMELIEGRENEVLNGLTPLIIASQNGHLQVVKELIKKGADVNLQDDDGKTPLIFASAFGDLNVVNELLKNGANLTKIDENFLQSIQSQEIKDTIRKYQDFHSKKDDEKILMQIKASLNQYLDGTKALTDFSSINFIDRGQQTRSIELNFDVIANIYDKDLVKANSFSCLTTGSIPLNIKELIKQVKELRVGNVIGLASASSLNQEVRINRP